MTDTGEHAEARDYGDVARTRHLSSCKDLSIRTDKEMNNASNSDTNIMNNEEQESIFIVLYRRVVMPHRLFIYYGHPSILHGGTCSRRVGDEILREGRTLPTPSSLCRGRHAMAAVTPSRAREGLPNDKFRRQTNTLIGVVAEDTKICLIEI